jgi:hypothetical protein
MQRAHVEMIEVRLRKKQDVDLGKVANGQRGRGQAFRSKCEPRQPDTDPREKCWISENLYPEKFLLAPSRARAIPRLSGYRSTPPDSAGRKLGQLDAGSQQSIRARDKRTNGERVNRWDFGFYFSSANLTIAGEFGTGKLATLAGAKNPGFAVARRRFFERLRIGCGVYCVRQPPRQDHSTGTIHDGHEIEEATACRQIDDLGIPDEVRPPNLQITLVILRRRRRPGA